MIYINAANRSILKKIAKKSVWNKGKERKMKEKVRRVFLLIKKQLHTGEEEIKMSAVMSNGKKGNDLALE